VKNLSEKKDIIGKDLKLKFDQLGADLTVTSEGDFDTVLGEDNLAQAIIARLSTDEGELYDIGHADYGSRLYDLIGEVNNETTRERIKSKVLDCLAQEPRIREVTSIVVKMAPYDLHQVEIEITVLPVGSNTFLTVVYPFRLEVK
jgi:phage baseplate assembly protein W